MDWAQDMRCRNRQSILNLVVCAYLAVQGCSEGTFPSVEAAKEYVVELATETGTLITENAETLAEALRVLWRRVFPSIEGNCEVDPQDPLRGKLLGVYRLEVVLPRDDGRRDRIKVELNEPTMQRTSENSPWELDPSNYPPLIREEIEP